ncbi:biotin transporter BioY [Euzebya tangerina]|uniref:biotin transporter BioY n=1 Tax=Euzebya tangerina TaxID=591198 RepID=UPI00196A8165|nr:biotin transporter BioY [Euzebya tangerina]
MSTLSAPLVPAWRPSWVNSGTRQAALVLAASGALAISAQVQIPMWPVPVTGQTFVVLLLGFLLGPRLAVAATLTYLVEGAVGLPVFAGFGAGVAVLTGPTAGYLWGFVLAAGLTGVLATRGWQNRPATTALAMLLGNVVIYLLGAGWLAQLTDVSTALSSGVWPFLVGDLAKIALATALVPALAARIGGATD